MPTCRFEATTTGRSPGCRTNLALIASARMLSVATSGYGSARMTAWAGAGPGRGADVQAWRRAAISRSMSGVKISCIASSIFPPGTTMMFGRDMNESCSIDSR